MCADEELFHCAQNVPHKFICLFRCLHPPTISPSFTVQFDPDDYKTTNIHLLRSKLLSNVY